MSKFIFDVDMTVRTPRLKRFRYEVDYAVVQAILDKHFGRFNAMKLSASELADLVNNRGEISTVARLRGSQTEIDKMLRSIALHISLQENPIAVVSDEDGGDNEISFGEVADVRAT